VLCRPEGRHIALREPLFRWRSKDGSSVLAYRDDAPYRADTKEAIAEAAGLPYDSMLVYGVTDHGGAPTIRSIEEIRESNVADFSTLNEFFDGRNTDYTVDTELITGDFGVYANHTEIKGKHRTAEYALLNAERASVMARTDDRATLENCWKDVLFCEFHDILGGASIKEAYVDAENMLGRAIMTANEWARHKNSSQPPKDVQNTATYQDYLAAQVIYKTNLWKALKQDSKGGK
jgi:alpha-mannosidase